MFSVKYDNSIYLQGRIPLEQKSRHLNQPPALLLLIPQQ
jgi:hypothetical protein